MVRHGFISWDDFANEDKVKNALRKFCDWAHEVLPQKVTHHGMGKSVIARGPRWKRIENFGEKSMNEAVAIIDYKYDPPEFCFGVMVSGEVYRRLKAEALASALPRPK
jgi:hypothetical protein